MSLQKHKLALLEQFHELLESQKIASTRDTLEHLHPAEIARLIESLPSPKREILWRLLNPAVEGQVLLELSEDIRNMLIASTDTHELVTALKDMEVDDLADLFTDLPQKVIDGILGQLALADRKRLEQVVSHAEDTAGGLMNIDTVTITENITVAIVIRYLRMLKELPKQTDRLIVVDYKNHYLGTVLLSTLITHEPNAIIREMMDREAEPIHVDATADEVVNHFSDFDLMSAPVVDNQGQLLGRITVDDVLNQVRDTARQAEFEAAGLASDESLFGSIKSSLQGRGVWLGINLTTAVLASWVIHLFDTTIEKTIALAVLLPIVASMGGIAGNQTMTLLIRGIATGQVGSRNILPLLKKEFSIGAINSLIWGAVVAAITVAWFNNWLLGGIICIAIILNLINATLSGFYIPFILKRLHVDPAIAGSVILTTLTDILGIFLFLGLATLLLI